MYAVYVPYIRDIRPSITVCRPTKGFAIITCHRCLLLLETFSPLSGGPGRSVCVSYHYEPRTYYIRTYILLVVSPREIRLGLFLY